MNYRRKWLKLLQLAVVLFLVGAGCDTASLPNNANYGSLPQSQYEVTTTNQIEKNNNQVSSDYNQQPVADDLSNNNYYRNSDGREVHSPAYERQENVVPAGASAQCGDGTYSFSQHRRGTCSHHGGVASWL